MLKKRKNYDTISFVKTCFAKCFPGHANCGFENHALNVFAISTKKFSSKDGIFRSRYDICWDTIIFPKVFSLKRYLWRRRLKLWKPCREFLAKVRICFPQSAKITQNQILLSKKTPQNYPLGTPNADLKTPAKLLCTKLENFLGKVQNVLEKRHFFKKIFSNCFRGNVGCGFEKPVKNVCCQKSETSSLKVSKLLKNQLFKKNHQNVPLDTPNADLTPPA